MLCIHRSQTINTAMSLGPWQHLIGIDLARLRLVAWHVPATDLKHSAQSHMVSRRPKDRHRSSAALPGGAASGGIQRLSNIAEMANLIACFHHRCGKCTW